MIIGLNIATISYQCHEQSFVISEFYFDSSKKKHTKNNDTNNHDSNNNNTIQLVNLRSLSLL